MRCDSALSGRSPDLTTMTITKAKMNRTAWLTAAALALMVCQTSLSGTGIALAQTTTQPDSSAVQQKPKEPGFFESIGRWFERGFSNLKGGMKDAKNNLDDFGDKAANTGKDIGDKAAQAGKNAAEAMRK